jgi:large subunit ribosomal protein L4
MLDIPVLNTDGEKIDTMQVDERVFGSQVNAPLLKQAVVTYHANKRQGSVATKSRGMVEGSTRKLFRQKGTGRARRGAIRTPVLRGGGMAFAKAPRSFRKRFPKKMRKAALNSAILAKILGEDFIIVDGLSMEAPKTREMARVASNLGINRSCLLALAGRDQNVYLSCRNIKDITVRIAEELNAFDVATRQKMVVTRDAMDLLVRGVEGKE